MNNGKLCPLKLQNGFFFGNCDKYNCAWYCENTKDCAITDIANHIRWISNIGVKDGRNQYGH